jgi:large subunit ribosomal protein L10e
MGNTTGSFDTKIELISKQDLQIRDNCLESARLTSNRTLETELGKTGFNMNLMVYPHHILRENPLAAGAGADRMSTGMKHSFGKVIGRAAQVKKGKVIMEVKVNKNNVEVAKKALNKARYKLPGSCSIQIKNG